MKNKLLPLLLLFVLFLVGHGITRAEEAEDRSYEMAQNAFESELYSHAHRWLLIYLTKYPQSKRLPDVFLRLGISSFHLEEYDRARGELKTLLDRFPQSEVTVSAKYWLGEVELAKGNLDTAIAHFRSVLLATLRSEYDEDAFLSLSYCLILQKKPEESLEVLQELTKRHPEPRKPNQYMFQRGISLFDIKDFSGAAKVFDSLILSNPEDKYAIQSLYWLAECYYNLNRYSDALATFYKIRKLTKSQEVIERILYGLGWTYYRMGEYTESYAAFSELLKFSPKTSFLASATFKMAENLYQLKRFDEAIVLFEKSRENPETSSASLFYLGECYYRLSQYKKALTFLAKVPKTADNTTYLLAIRDIGLCHYELGEFGEAIKTFDHLYEIAEDETTKAEALTYKADVHYASGAVVTALQIYRETIEKFVSQVNIPKVRYYIAMCLYRMEEYDEAAEILVNTYSRYSENEYGVMAIYQHAELLRRQEKYEEAVERYIAFLDTTVVSDKLNRYRIRAPLSIAVSRFNLAGGNKEEIEKVLLDFVELARTSTDIDVRSEAYFQSARCLFELGRKREAQETLKLIVEKFRDTEYAPAAQFEIGYNCYTRKEYPEAMLAFEDVLKLFPNCPQADDSFMYLSIISFEGKRPVEARKYIDRFMEQFPSSELLSRMKILSAGVLVLEQKYSEALAEYNKLEKELDSAMLRQLVALETGELFLMMRKPNEAIEKFRYVENSTVNEWAARAEIGAGRALQAIGKSEDALEHYLKLIFSFPDDPRRDEAIFEASQIQTDFKQYAEAIKLLNLASDKERAGMRIKKIQEIMEQQ